MLTELLARIEMDKERYRKHAMGTHKIDIHVTPGGCGSTIKFDGVELPMVRAFSVHAEPEKATKVVVEFVACEVNVSGECIGIDAIFKRARLAGSI